MLKVATVCTGIGSPEKALVNLGIEHEIAFACEIDKYARQTYLTNFEPKLMLSDMTKETWKGNDFYSDLFIGGIPCQAFSLAGKRLGELDPRGLLFYDFYRYVQIQQPKYFIIENVKGLLSDDSGKTFRNWIQLLGRSENTHVNMFNHPDSLEYNLHWKVLNSKDFGVPQNRERVFIVGIRKDLDNAFRFPIGWRLDKRLKDILEPEVDEKYYLSDTNFKYLERAKERNRERVFITDGEDDISTCITSNLHKGLHNGGETLIKEVGKLNSSQDGRVFDTNGISQCLSSGNNNSPKIIVPAELIKSGRIIGRNPDNPKSRKSGMPTEQMLEINENSDITNTVTTVQKDNVILEYKGVAVHPFSKKLEFDGFKDGNCPTLLATDYKAPKCIQVGHRIRRLTPLECFRLQGFPDDYIKPCSDSQTYKQAGNSITVNVMQAILKNLLL